MIGIITGFLLAISTACFALVTPNVTPYLTETPIHISAGNLSTPYVISQANTEYILDGNITADSTAFYVQANYVALNLNGYSITYNNVSPGAGVWINAWNIHDVAIHNGSIVQGSAMSEGDDYGIGSNPIRNAGGLYPDDTYYGKISTNVQVADIDATYGGRDTGGIYLEGTGHTVEGCTLTDAWGYGTLKNRHQGVKAINFPSEVGTVKNNVIVNARQIGINGASVVYGNTIGILSKATNSTAISAGPNSVVHDNIITGRGEHPIGVYVGGIPCGEVYNNTIDVQTTAGSSEYGFAKALGIRSTSSIVPADGCLVHDNDITVTTNMHYTGGVWSETGASISELESQGKGIVLGLDDGQSAYIYNNDVTVTDADGTADISVGLACANNNSDELIFYNNTVTTNVSGVHLGDSYGYCKNYPLFKGNTFVRTGSYSEYSTIRRGLGGYFPGTGRFVDNIYQDGAALTSRDLYPGNDGDASYVSVYFGNEVAGVDKYYMQIHDNNSASNVEIQTDYDPTITLPYPSVYQSAITTPLRTGATVTRIGSQIIRTQ